MSEIKYAISQVFRGIRMLEPAAIEAEAKRND